MIRNSAAPLVLALWWSVACHAAPVPLVRVNESSSLHVTACFATPDGTRIIPDSIQWAVIDETSGTVLSGPTSVDPARCVKIVVPDSVQTLVDEPAAKTSQCEVHVFAIKWTWTSSGQTLGERAEERFCVVPMQYSF